MWYLGYTVDDIVGKTTGPRIPIPMFENFHSYFIFSREYGSTFYAKLSKKIVGRAEKSPSKQFLAETMMRPNRKSKMKQEIFDVQNQKSERWVTWMTGNVAYSRIEGYAMLNYKFVVELIYEDGFATTTIKKIDSKISAYGTNNFRIYWLLEMQV